jgi:predicted secreted hydrolase
MRALRFLLLCVLAMTARAAPLDVLRADQVAPGFAQVEGPWSFSFPRDHGPHESYQHEWWYFTGHLTTTSGARYGFELTFFRIGLAPPAAPADARLSRWHARQVYAAHFAITDLGRRQFHAQARYARDALGLAGAARDPWRVWLGGWSAGASPGGTWSLQAAAARFGLDLQLVPLMAPVLNGTAGLSVKADVPGAASEYYSVPRLAAQGNITIDGTTQAVKGLAWLDREWGSGALGPHQEGWDWFALQLADGSSLMFYALRDRGGATDPHSAGTYVGSDGRPRALAASDVQIEVQDHWVSPLGGRYPARWRLRVSSLGLDLELRPVLADQELDTAPRYWEGAVDVQGTRAGRPLRGEGYVELVGYVR